MVVELSIVPLDKGESLAPYVAQVVDIIRKSGLSYELTSMSTQIEGDWDEVMAVIRKCHFELRKTSKRVVTSIKIDDREGATGRLKGKVTEVTKFLK